MRFWLKPRSFWSLSLLTFSLILAILFFILPSNFSWMGYKSSVGDAAQHLSGWYAFVHESWHFPLLKIDSLNYPMGATISLTDSIPLFALSFKLLRGILLKGFNYFGIFILFIYFLQGFSALCLAYSLKKNNLLAVSALVIIALTSPILSIRVGVEDSLAGQGLILLALGGYFFIRFNALHHKGAHWFYGILIACSLLIHPYLTAMIYPFYIISLITLRQQQRLPWSLLVGPILIMHLFILLEFILLGLGQGAQDFDDFGLFSMNLLAPVSGGWFTDDVSIFATPYQYEGFAYLGLGLIGVLIFAFAFSWGVIRARFKQYRALVVVGCIFFILAIYGHIYFGHYKVIIYGVPHFFFTYDFKSNGRFFWPVWYILMTFGVVTLLNYKPRFSVVLIPLLLSLQIFDVSGYIKATRNVLQENFSAQAITPNMQQIKSMIADSKILIFYPKIGCPNMDYNLIINTQLIAAESGVAMNTAYLAHFKSPFCTDDANAFPALRPALLVSNTNSPSPSIQELLRSKPEACQVIDQVYYCKYGL